MIGVTEMRTGWIFTPMGDMLAPYGLMYIMEGCTGTDTIIRRAACLRFETDVHC